jgi:hypothetical protein
VTTLATPRVALVVLLAGSLFLTVCTNDKPSSSSSPSPATAPSDTNAANGGAPAPPAETLAPAPAQSPAPAAPAPEVAQTPPPPPAPVVIPDGTVLTVRLQQALGSKSSQQGDRFDAIMSEPLVVKGKTVVPAGASASGAVTEAHAAGRFKGGATLNLVLDHVIIRGVRYRVQTATMSQTSKGKGKRTAAMVGGGGGAGALIGGIAGGGKGAAIGALVGAGAGTAGAGLTGNRDITMPAESAVSFQMTHSLTLKPQVNDVVRASNISPENTGAPPPQ